jgi:hypothetical protein
MDVRVAVVVVVVVVVGVAADFSSLSALLLSPKTNGAALAFSFGRSGAALLVVMWRNASSSSGRMKGTRSRSRSLL